MGSRVSRGYGSEPDRRKRSGVSQRRKEGSCRRPCRAEGDHLGNRKGEDLCVIQGPTLLQQAAFDAVKTWTYNPFLLNGQPREVKTQMNIDFTLQ